MEGVATERERRGVVVGEEMQSVRLKEKGELCRIIANYQQALVSNMEHGRKSFVA